jgi:predicted Zn finger-like uncharacterized protein
MGPEIGDLDGEGAHAFDSTAMILTCPECASRYLVGDDSIGAAGRSVRCSSCGARWTARADDAPAAPAPIAAAAPVAAPPTPSLDSAAAEPDITDDSAEPLPKVFRERAATRQKVREAMAAGAVWAGLAAGFVLLLGATVLLRQDVARIWPRTAGAYAAVGLPVNLIGLTIENQHAQPQLQDGHAALMVTGSLRNIRDRPVVAPPLRITLVNPSGRSLAVKIADPDGARIPPGEARRFVVNMLDPPVSATAVNIAFVLNQPPHKGPAAPGAPLAAKLSLRGADVAPGPPPSLGPVVPHAAAQDAKPLPSASPYALPKAADQVADPRG